MSSALNIAQVAQLIGRSTKSVRNYIKEDKLTAKKVPSPRGLEYTFDFGDVAKFAKKHLKVTIEANVPAVHTKSSRGSRGSSDSEITKMMTQLEKDKTELLKEMGEFKAQAGYKIGQLESQVKLLEVAKTERDSLQKKYDDLGVKYTVRDKDARVLLRMKHYYDAKKWWHVWKGRYQFDPVATESDEA